MARVNRKRYIEMRLIQVDGTPETGRVLSDFQVFFTRDTVTCTDSVSSVELGSGRYVIEYTPTLAGHDYIEIYDPPTDLRVIDSEDVDDTSTFFDLSSVVQLSQDYGSVGRLKPTVTNPQDYILYVFKSSDWDTGKTSPNYAIGVSGLDISGNWTSTPISVIHGTYHIVVIGPDGTKIVLAVYLEI